MIPEYWTRFIEAKDLVGREFELSKREDLSELGVDLKIMSASQYISEATQCHPGIEALKERYIPVGMCLTGTGDYYYINENDLENGPLYRIYHDAVADGKIIKSEIDRVLNKYESLL